MKEQEELGILKIGKYCAKLSFIIGTVIFLLYYLSRREGFTAISFMYLVAAFIINSILFLVLLITLISYPKRFIAILNTMGIVLLNIPVTAFYLWLFFQLHSKF